MKKLIAIAILFATFAAPAVDVITATVAITNSAGTTNGQVFSINAVTRTWTNSVVVPGVQILTNSAAATALTNLFNQVSAYPVAGLSLSYASSTSLALRAFPNAALTVTNSPGVGSVVYTTNVLTPAVAVRVPNTVETAAQRTNVASGLVAWLNLATTNQLAATGSAAQQLAPRTNGVVWSPVIVSPVTTNLVNRGNAISSPGNTGTDSENLGTSAFATNDYALAVGKQSLAGGIASIAVGYIALALGDQSTAIGLTAQAKSNNAIAIGNLSEALNDDAIAIGYQAQSTHSKSVAIGSGATSTSSNQIMLGTSSIDVTVNHDLSVGGEILRAKFGSTNRFPAGSDIAFGRYALSSLANGANADIPVGTNVFVQVSGPSAAFSVAGIDGQPNRDGKLLMLYNATGQTMTLLNESGLDATAANRILTASSADLILRGRSFATLIYSASSSRWLVSASEKSDQGFGSGSFACSTNMVVATSTSTNSVNGWSYTKTLGTVGAYTNTVFWVTNAGTYSVSFGASLLASGSDVLKLMLYTNYVHCPVTELNTTMGASPLAETGFKSFLLDIPANTHVMLKVANDSAASVTMGNAVFNIHGVE